MKNKRKKVSAKKKTRPDIISYRKSCSADGTGLSHYILADKKAR